MDLRACKEIDCVASGDWPGHRDRRGELRELTDVCLAGSCWPPRLPTEDEEYLRGNGVDRGKLSSVLNTIKGSLLDIQERVSRRRSRTQGENCELEFGRCLVLSEAERISMWVEWVFIFLPHHTHPTTLSAVQRQSRDLKLSCPFFCIRIIPAEEAAYKPILLRNSLHFLW